MGDPLQFAWAADSPARKLTEIAVESERAGFNLAGPISYGWVLVRIIPGTSASKRRPNA